LGVGVALGVFVVDASDLGEVFVGSAESSEAHPYQYNFMQR
jgi:hypothetical protein